MAISKKTRFEVFKRDSFKCQYCGKSAPDVLLEADHIEPASKGGSDDIMNLVTAYQECNRGKSDRKLSDNTVIQRRKQQLDDLPERREQLDMMMRWQKELLGIHHDEVQQLADYWHEATDQLFSLNESGSANLRTVLKRFGFSETFTAMKTAIQVYFKYDGAGDLTQESIEQGFKKIPGIATINKQGGFDEHYSTACYIAAIIDNKSGPYVDKKRLASRIWRVLKSGVESDELIHFAKGCDNQHQWNTHFDGLEEHLENNGDG